MWPHLLDLNPGESFRVPVMDGSRCLKLVALEEFYEPDWWCKNNSSRRTLAQARLSVEVDGEPGEVWLRPYQMPVVVNGLRLYGEWTRNWATACDYAGIEGVRHAARIAALDEHLPWGPEEFVFPLRGYRWRGNTYNNTWLSLVPYNALYYHRGEDFGAIPSRMTIHAGLPGKVVASPLPSGDGRSNGLSIESSCGATLRYAHMNLEDIAPDLSIGATVERGQLLARTGETWSGKKCQTHDPHLHFDISRGGQRTGSYPFVVGAYFRSNSDALVANAGGYAFGIPGTPITLDATRSLARPGRSIASHTWVLHDGSRVERTHAEFTYDRPGLYSEELIVRADDGSEDRDYLQVRIYLPEAGRSLARGWMYHWPQREIRPGTAVLFWNRLMGTQEPALIDFGDGSPPQTIRAECVHSYDRAGTYTARLDSRGPGDEPVTLKMRVVVESDLPS